MRPDPDDDVAVFANLELACLFPKEDGKRSSNSCGCFLATSAETAVLGILVSA